MLDVGILDIPIPSSPEQPALVSLSPPNTPIVSSLVSGSSSPAQLSHAAVAIAKSSKSLASVRRFRFKKLGFSRGTRKVLKNQYSSRTINQYNGAWLSFSAFVSKKKLPKAKVKESTVLNYLSSRLKDPAKPEKGKVAPSMLRDLSALCPLRAFRIFSDMRSAQESSQRLWLHGSSPKGFLSRAVVKVINESMKMAHPLPPAGGYPRAGTHHLRKFSLSFAYKYGICNDLQQLWDRVGSKSKVTPLSVYIRNVPDITFYMCAPLGTLRPDMPPLRGASDPVRS